MNQIILNEAQINAILGLLSDMPGRFAIPLDHIMREAAGHTKAMLDASGSDASPNDAADDTA